MKFDAANVAAMSIRTVGSSPEGTEVLPGKTFPGGIPIVRHVLLPVKVRPFTRSVTLPSAFTLFLVLPFPFALSFPFLCPLTFAHQDKERGEKKKDRTRREREVGLRGASRRAERLTESFNRDDPADRTLTLGGGRIEWGKRLERPSR